MILSQKEVVQVARRKPNPADSLGRFMIGIYDYYHDRGMPTNTAKARMIDSTLEQVSNLMKAEQDIPDQMLVLMAQWMSRSLNNRGAQITKELKDTPQEQLTSEILQPLNDIKAAKDAIDVFIKSYEGRRDAHGSKKA